MRAVIEYQTSTDNAVLRPQCHIRFGDKEVTVEEKPRAWLTGNRYVSWTWFDGSIWTIKSPNWFESKFVPRWVICRNGTELATGGVVFGLRLRMRFVISSGGVSRTVETSGWRYVSFSDAKAQRLGVTVSARISCGMRKTIICGSRDQTRLPLLIAMSKLQNPFAN